MLYRKSEQLGTRPAQDGATAFHKTVGYLFAFLLLSGTQITLADSGAIKRAPVEKAGSISRTYLIKPEPRENKLDTLKNDITDLVRSIDEIIDEPLEATTENSTDVIAEESADRTTPPEPVVAAPQAETEKPAIDTQKIQTEKPEPVIHAQDSVVVKADNVEQPKAPESKLSETSPLVKGSYLKHDINGKPLNDDVSQWACVEDRANGLVWEVKSSDGGLRDKDHLYSWFNPEDSSLKGIADGGRCKGNINCDTNAYIQAMNRQKLCGHDDWRLPTREEMQSLVSFDNTTSDARINREYFPDTLPSWYWTATSNSNNPDYAWYVLFRNGVSLNDLKSRPKHIRLVRKGDEA